VACPTLVTGGEKIRTVTTVLSFDDATEVSTSQLRIGFMFSADDASNAALRRLLVPTASALTG
jgi:hypothetical protein